MRRTMHWLLALRALLVAAPLTTATLAYAADDLMRATESNDTTAALAAIAAGSNVSAITPDGTTPLHWAAYHGNAPLVERLIAAGANVGARNEFGSTPLAEAGTVGEVRVLRALLDAGAAVDAEGPDGQTALMAVARGGNTAAATLLIERGANVNARERWREQTPLMWAAAQSQPSMVELLIARGAEVNARSAVNAWPRQVTAEPRRMYRPFGGLTPLLFAAREGCLDCVRALVKGGADINLSDPKGVTPLFLAIDNLHFDTAKYLLEAGANPNKWDWWGRTPLYSAVDVNVLPHGGRADRRSVDATTSLEIVEMLLEAGAWPDVQLKLLAPFRHIGDDRGCDLMLVRGVTPLLRAAKTFDMAAMKLLIEHGAKLDLPNEGGITPLMAAAGLGSVECDPRGYGPGIPHYTSADVEAQSISALKLLLDAGARIDARTSSGNGAARSAGRTALFGAAFWGWTNVVDYLVERGADIDVAEAEGLTPVDAARGRAGGHGRGSTIEVYEDTAKRLEELCSQRPSCNLARPERL